MPTARQAVVLLALLAAALGALSCVRGSEPAAAPNSPQRLRAVIVPPPCSLIPREGNVYSDGQFTDLIFSNLVCANYQGSLSPELAERWKISPDRREYTFQLRPNVRFHDGRPFTAADVVFTLEELIAKSRDRYAEMSIIEGFDDFLSGRSRRLRGLQPLSDHVIRIRLREQFKYFLPFLSAEYTAIVPKDYGGRTEAEFRRRPAGTGPYRLARTLTRSVAGHSLLLFQLEKNHEYFAPMGNVEAIDFYAAKTAVEARDKDRFDLLYLSNSEIPEIQRLRDFRLINSSPTIVNFLVLNPRENARMRDGNVRRLIHYGIDREELVRKVFRRQARPAYSMIPFGLLGHNPYQRLDASRAASIRAGLPPETIRFSLLTLARDKRQLVAEFIAKSLARFGVDVKVVTVDDPYDFFNTRIYDTDSSVFLGAIPDYPSSHHFLSHLAAPAGSYNIFRFSFPDLYSRIRTLPGVDMVGETRALAEINDALERDPFFVPLYHDSNFIAVRNRIRNIRFKYGETPDFAGLEVGE